jgi:general secretion pathway protein D
VVRITAEPRTNAVIVSATKENTEIIKGLIDQLDAKEAAAVKLKVYTLRYADASSTAQLVTDLFSASGSSSQRRGSSRDGRSSSSMPFWMRGFMGSRGSSSSDQTGSAKEVRAIADVRTNTVLVAASEQNLAIIDQLVLELDRQISDMLVVKIYELEHADAAEMATVLQSLFRPQVNATRTAGGMTPRTSGSSGGSSSWFQRMMSSSRGGGTGNTATLAPGQEVEITSDQRTNTVIVKASREYITIMDDVVSQLDANPTEESTVFVMPLKNHDALELATTLQSLLRGTGTSSRSSYNRGTSSLFNRSTTSQYQSGRSQRSSFGSSTRGSSSSSTRRRNLGPLEAQDEPLAPLQEEEQESRPRGVEGQVDIEPDPITNTLVVRGDPKDVAAIRTMLADLDRARPQVLIKVLIADVTLDERTQFGVEGFWENGMTVRGGDLATQRYGLDLIQPTSGFSYLLTGDEFEASLNLFASEGKLKVLATPRILALDNQPADIRVGKEVPIITNVQTNQLTGTPINTVSYESVGIILEVTPHINPDGLVTLEVLPEISDVASEAESVQIVEGANSPTFNVNSASTTVAVSSGTTVDIGGLIRETMDDAVQGIPILMDIPLVGPLFSSTTKRKVKRELMIFLTPYVANTAAELEELSALETAQLKLIDPRDIKAESDQWLRKARR